MKNIRLSTTQIIVTLVIFFGCVAFVDYLITREVIKFPSYIVDKPLTSSQTEALLFIFLFSPFILMLWAILRFFHHRKNNQIPKKDIDKKNVTTLIIFVIGLLILLWELFG